MKKKVIHRVICPNKGEIRKEDLIRGHYSNKDRTSRWKPDHAIIWRSNKSFLQEVNVALVVLQRVIWTYRTACDLICINYRCLNFQMKYCWLTISSIATVLLGTCTVQVIWTKLSSICCIAVFYSEMTGDNEKLGNILTSRKL